MRGGAEVFGAVASRLGPMGLEAESLPPRLAFDVRLWELRQWLAEENDDAEAEAEAVSAATRVRVMAFLAQARALEREPAVGALLDDLTRLIGPNAAVREGLIGAGPAAAGWRLEGDTPPGLLVYHRGAARLVFQRVEAPGGATYLQTRELSVGDVQAMFDGGEASRQALALLRAGTPETGWPGPRAWRFDDEAADGPSIGVSERGWLASGPAELPGVETGTPTDGHPITHVSAEAAAALAERFGCALPTAEVWLAGYRAQRVADRAVVNRRDVAWARYASAANAAPRGEGRPRGEPTDAGFIARGGSPTTGDSADDGSFLAIDDGTVWLAEPDDAEPGTLQHLVGNAAEWVTINPVDAAPLFDPAGGSFQQRVERFRQRHGGDFAVLGGSFLSPPSVPLDEPQPLDPRRISRGFADVGLRLAFTPARLTPTRQIIERLAQQPYLGGK